MEGLGDVVFHLVEEGAELVWGVLVPGSTGSLDALLDACSMVA